MKRVPIKKPPVTTKKRRIPNPQALTAGIPQDKTGIPAAKNPGRTARPAEIRRIHQTERKKTGVWILPTGTGRGTGKTGGIPTGTPGTEMPADAGRTDDCPASNPPKSWKVTGRKPPGAWKRRYLPRARRPRMSAEAWTGSSRSPTGAGRITGSFCGSLPSCGK